MTVREFLEKYGYDYLLSLLGSKIFEVKDNLVFCGELTGIIHNRGNICFQLNYASVNSRIFLSKEDAYDYLNM